MPPKSKKQTTQEIPVKENNENQPIQKDHIIQNTRSTRSTRSNTSSQQLQICSLEKLKQPRERTKALFSKEELEKLQKINQQVQQEEENQEIQQQSLEVKDFDQQNNIQIPSNSLQQQDQIDILLEKNVIFIDKLVNLERSKNVDYSNKYHLLTNIVIDPTYFTEEAQNKLKQCINIKQLTINPCYNPVNKEDMQRLCESISKFSKLSNIILNFNSSKVQQFQLQGLVQIVLNKINLAQLTLLLDQTCGISTIKVLQQQLPNLINLKQLNISLYKIKLQTNEVIRLSQAITQCKQLKKIDFYLSNIGFSKPEGLLSEFSKLENLDILSLTLSQNQINDKNALVLGQEIKQFINLRELKLQLCNNPIGDNGAISIMKGLSQSASIKKVDLYMNNCNISNEGIQSIGQLLGISQHIQHLKLNLYESHIEEEGYTSLFSGISKLEGLKSLYLWVINYKLPKKSFDLRILAKYLQRNKSLQNLLLCTYCYYNDKESLSEFAEILLDLQNLNYFFLNLNLKLKGNDYLQYNQMKTMIKKKLLRLTTVIFW